MPCGPRFSLAKILHQTGRSGAFDCPANIDLNSVIFNRDGYSLQNMWQAFSRARKRTARQSPSLRRQGCKAAQFAPRDESPGAQMAQQRGCVHASMQHLRLAIPNTNPTPIQPLYICCIAYAMSSLESSSSTTTISKLIILMPPFEHNC